MYSRQKKNNRSIRDVDTAENYEDQLNGKKIEQGSVKHGVRTQTNYQND